MLYDSTGMPHDSQLAVDCEEAWHDWWNAALEATLWARDFGGTLDVYVRYIRKFNHIDALIRREG